MLCKATMAQGVCSFNIGAVHIRIFDSATAMCMLDTLLRCPTSGQEKQVIKLDALLREADVNGDGQKDASGVEPSRAMQMWFDGMLENAIGVDKHSVEESRCEIEKPQSSVASKHQPVVQEPVAPAKSSESPADVSQASPADLQTLVDQDSPMLTKTRMCKFFARGQCTRGEKCSFTHNSSELQKQPDLYRTQLCIINSNTQHKDARNTEHEDDLQHEGAASPYIQAGASSCIRPVKGSPTAVDASCIPSGARTCIPSVPARINSSIGSRSRSRSSSVGSRFRVEETYFCDGCDADPITGNCYHSLEKDDYHLCTTCYDSVKRDPAQWICASSESVFEVPVFNRYVALAD